jgi:hypothetical protein
LMVTSEDEFPLPEKKLETALPTFSKNVAIKVYP